jgi:hypothetical protein
LTRDEYVVPLIEPVSGHARRKDVK